MPRRLPGLTAALLCAIAGGALLHSGAAAAAVPAGSTVLIDRPTGFGALPFDGVSAAVSGGHAVSAGSNRYVVFSSSSDGLLAGDDNSSTHVYRLDRSTGQVQQVDTFSTGAQPPSGSFSGAESISASGRYVAFSSTADFVGGAPIFGVYVKDMDTGRIELASRSTGSQGTPVAGLAEGVISGDGRHVAFAAIGTVRADNADGPADEENAYVRSLDGGTTHMVSITSTGAPGSAELGTQAIDIDFSGDAVAFISAGRLDPGDTDSDDDAYLRRGIGTRQEETCFVSFTTNQTTGADQADRVTLSGDGLSAAWTTGQGVFFSRVIASAMGKATQLDVALPNGTDGSNGDDPAFEPVSAAGQAPRHVFFITDTALAPGDTNNADDVYDADVAFPGQGDHVELDTSGSRSGSIDTVAGAGAGTTIVYSSDSPDLPGATLGLEQVYLPSGGNDEVISETSDQRAQRDSAGNDEVNPTHAVSDGGRVVVYRSDAPALGSNAFGEPQEIIARDVASGLTTVVSSSPNGAPATADSHDPTIDAAGDRVAFLSQDESLLSTGNPSGGESHAYTRDLPTGAMTLVDRSSQGAPLRDGVTEARVSPDGRHLVYITRSPDAPAAPGDGNQHAYLVDLTTGVTQLVDRTPGGTAGNGQVSDVDVSADGSHVAFVSSANNLGAGGNPDHPQAYVRDAVANTTTWASVPENGNPLNADVESISLSGSGQRVAFEQLDPGFGNGMHDNRQVFVRDLAAGTTTLGSVVPNDPTADGFSPSLSADGQRLAFAAEDLVNFFGAAARPAVVGAAALPVPPGVYLRDLGSGTTSTVGVRLDGSGPGVADFDSSPSVDGTGSCVAFMSASASALTSPAYGPDFDHVYLRAVGDCPVSPVTSPPPGPQPAPTPEPAGGSPGAGTTSGSGAPARDTTPPRITGARLNHRRFVVGSAKPARRSETKPARPRGTTFDFVLSEPARTTIAIARHEPGRRSGKRCVAPRKGLNRSCIRVVGVISIQAPRTRKGPNRVVFSGRVGRLVLRPGSYQAKLTARDRAGNRSRPVVLRFTVVER